MDVNLQPGDIFLTRGTGLLSRLIRVCTRSFGEKRTKVNHVGIVVEGGGMKEAVVVEALSKVKRHRLWIQYGPPNTGLVAVYRAKNIRPEEMQVIVAEAEEQVGKPYGHFKIVMHFLDWCLTGVYFFRRFARSEKYPICSWLVACAYGAAYYDFGVPNEAADPDDIWDFVRRRTDYYEEIVHLGPLTGFVGSKKDLPGVRESGIRS